MSAQTTSTKPYESIDLAYRQEDEHGTNKPLELSHVEYVKAETGEILRVTVENKLYQGGGPDAVVHLLSRNQEWTNLLSVPERVWWKQFTPGPFQTGATRETNRENMARIADELLRRAAKILAAAAS
jgi:hypothetical protein